MKIKKDMRKKRMVLLVGGGEGGEGNEIINESLQTELDNLFLLRLNLNEVGDGKKI